MNLVLGRFLLLMLITLPFIGRRVDTGALKMSFPTPSSMRLRCRPSGYIPPVVRGRRCAFSELLRVTLFYTVRPVGRPMAPFNTCSVTF